MWCSGIRSPFFQPRGRGAGAYCAQGMSKQHALCRRGSPSRTRTFLGFSMFWQTYVKTGSSRLQLNLHKPHTQSVNLSISIAVRQHSCASTSGSSTYHKCSSLRTAGRQWSDPHGEPAVDHPPVLLLCLKAAYQIRRLNHCR